METKKYIKHLLARITGYIEKSIDMLKDGGFLCYVTPNNWMTYNSNNTTLKKLLKK